MNKTAAAHFQRELNNNKLIICNKGDEYVIASTTHAMLVGHKDFDKIVKHITLPGVGEEITYYSSGTQEHTNNLSPIWENASYDTEEIVMTHWIYEHADKLLRVFSASWGNILINNKFIACLDDPRYLTFRMKRNDGIVTAWSTGKMKFLLAQFFLKIPESEYLEKRRYGGEEDNQTGELKNSTNETH